ncbi:hypothetical protein DdX_00776 [Ditylenchus destructor]|uniref:Uncharacterized protein n=1 Tax=Ditylenchus destructor TaxID=166010 RepID=A0AAD4RAQ2_9BILA|nr:hypothetical protein DdX_00776 [Ditylenchus destructor]
MKGLDGQISYDCSCNRASNVGRQQQELQTILQKVVHDTAQHCECNETPAYGNRHLRSARKENSRSQDSCKPGPCLQQWECVCVLKPDDNPQTSQLTLYNPPKRVKPDKPATVLNEQPQTTPTLSTIYKPVLVFKDKKIFAPVATTSVYNQKITEATKTEFDDDSQYQMDDQISADGDSADQSIPPPANINPCFPCFDIILNFSRVKPEQQESQPNETEKSKKFDRPTCICGPSPVIYTSPTYSPKTNYGPFSQTRQSYSTTSQNPAISVPAYAPAYPNLQYQSRVPSYTGRPARYNTLFTPQRDTYSGRLYSQSQPFYTAQSYPFSPSADAARQRPEYNTASSCCWNENESKDESSKSKMRSNVDFLVKLLEKMKEEIEF